MNSGLAGRAAMVTGASGGIGLEVARALAAEGCRLVLQARSGAASLRARLAGEGLHDALLVEADVRDPHSVERMFAEAAERTGGMDVCVASAGIWPEEHRRIDELPLGRARDVLETNLFGSLWTARSFLAQVGATGRRGSSLVLIGSTAGRFGEAGHADYAVSKAGLRGLMLSYKNEVVTLDPEGRCNLVEPGWTLTAMTESALQEDEVVRRVTCTMPLRRIATPRDVAAAVLYFAAPRLSAHVSGETITVAGGMEGRGLWQSEQIDPEAIRRRLREDG
jgi:3-oxoacyl-[acyl-carrier protein] reductase